MITIKDVAAAAGVSIATVSRVVNDYPHVRAEVRERVQQAITTMGYRPNRLASSFRTQQSRVIGVFLRQQRTPFSSALAYAIEATLFDAGYRVLLCSTNGDAEREESYVQSMTEMRAEGVIIRPSGSTAATIRNVGKLREAQISVVFVDAKPKLSAMSAVICDNYSGGYEGIRYLVELGHRRIGIIVGSTAMPVNARNVGTDRLRGILQAAKDLGQQVELVFSGAFEEAGFEIGAIEADALLQRDPGLTALFATTDMLAIGAMHAARRRGLRLPQDLSIIGYDGVMESSLTFPALTTVRQPIHEMGVLAAKILLGHIRDATSVVQHAVLENTLLVRGSTAAVEIAQHG